MDRFDPARDQRRLPTRPQRRAIPGIFCASAWRRPPDAFLVEIVRRNSLEGVFLILLVSHKERLMLRKIDWESQIGRRLKLRDLHVFCTTVRCGSMAKAAQQLGVSQPAVSEVVADLEHALGVRLLDRHSQGIEPTLYGAALLKRSVAAFDELKQSIRDIEFLTDPTVGELRVGCPESLSSGILPQVIRRF